MDDEIIRQVISIKKGAMKIAPFLVLVLCGINILDFVRGSDLKRYPR